MKILGTGSALPAMTLTNDMLTAYFDTNDEWISTRTGIRQRQVITDETLDDLGTEAAKKALENAGLTAGDLDLIVCSNVMEEYISPSLACRIQGKLGAKCPAFTLNAGCAGFLFAMSTAEAYLSSGMYRNILVLAAEMPTRMASWSDRSTAILFGDGAGAIVVTQGDNVKSMKLSTRAMVGPLYQKQALNPTPFDKERPVSEDTPEYEKAKHSFLQMDGKEVFKLAVISSIRDINFLLQDAGVSVDQVSYFLFHQANLRILESVRTHLKQGPEKFYHNVEHTGNTSSASVPILLDEMNRKGMLKRGDLLVMSAFGAGFSTGAFLIEW